MPWDQSRRNIFFFYMWDLIKFVSFSEGSHLKEKAKSQKWLAVVPEKTLLKSILPVNHLGQMTDHWFSKFFTQDLLILLKISDSKDLLFIWIVYSNALRPAHTGLQELIVCDYSIFRVQWNHLGRLKSTVIGVIISWKIRVFVFCGLNILFLNN